ncbi:helix-turn-helix domain-containing protein [uncultured Corynebacterium sp.]|uniref:helix-turn-helix domain-containing protein n=1 Tax=uncultured Corynebacterium sp. TaxID=159447 RepID=UPI0025DC0E0E|nr:helix-turn-helix domain-containing protein [uncultured Corynebacterium sp.]
MNTRMRAGDRVRTLPAAWLDNVTAYTDCHVFWVEHGHAQVMVGGELYRLGELEALWIPPGMTVDYIETTEDSVALSVLIPVGSFPEVPSVVIREFLTRDTADVLLHLYSRWKMPDWKGHDPRDPLAALGGRSGRTEGPLTGAAEDLSLSLPPLPDHWAAKQIGQQILDDPSDRRRIVEWAQAVGYTARHITEMFRASTGMGIGAWRQRVRAVTAFHLIRQGVPVEDAAEATGYGSAGALSEAFHRETSARPSEVCRRRRCEPETTVYTSGTGAWDGSPLAEVLGPADAIPAADLRSRVNSFHVMIWMVRGAGKLVLGDGVVDLVAGDGVWIPAGVWHRLRMDAGAVMVPVGELPGKVALRRRHIRPTRFRTDARAELLYRSMVGFTALRPVSGPGVEMTDLVPETVDLRAAGDPVLARLLDDAHSAETSERLLAERIGCSLESFDRRFLGATGQCFEQWVIDRKMLRARILLANPDLSVTEIGLRIGYRHGSSFTRAFLGAHNVKPTEYRRAYLYRQTVSMGVE